MRNTENKTYKRFYREIKNKGFSPHAIRRSNGLFKIKVLKLETKPFKVSGGFMLVRRSFEELRKDTLNKLNGITLKEYR